MMNDTMGNFCQILDYLPIPAWILNSDALVISSNSLGKNLLSSPQPSDASSSSFLSVEKEYEADFRQTLTQAFSEGNATLEDCAFLNHTREVHYFRISANRLDIGEHAEPVVLVCAILNDERRMDRDSLLIMQGEQHRQSRRYKEFLTQAGFELATPIKTATQLLLIARKQLEQGSSKKLDSYLHSIGQSINSLAQIVQDIKNYSEVLDETAGYEMRDFSLQALIERSCRAPQILAAEKSLDFRIRTEKIAGNIYKGNPRRIQQIIDPLLANAIQYTEEGQISVIVREEALGEFLREVRIEIRDTGPGMTPAQSALIWNIDNGSDKQNYGIGLSIAKRLAASIHAQLYFETARNFGTSFFLNMSLSLSENQDADENIESLPTPRSKLHILLFQAENSCLSNVATEIRALGHGLTILAHDACIDNDIEGFDAVILEIDNRDSGCIGLMEHMRTLRKNGTHADIALLAISSFSEETISKWFAQPLPWDEFSAPPKSADALIYLIHSILN